MELVEHQPYHSLLQEAFQARREKNPSYSLRAFSRALGISPTTLSKVFRYERNLSPRNLQKLGVFLELSPFEIEKLSLRKMAKRVEPTARRMAEDEFHLISDWFHFAILNLAKIPSSRFDAGWISRRLAIGRVEANGALKRLERMGLIEKKGRRLVRTSARILTTTDVPSRALKKFHRQQLNLAIEALQNVPVERRDITSVTMAVDPARLTLAKKKIAEFRDLLSDFLEGGEKKEVYLLSFQLFPLEQREKAT
jgi:uncharacterized protein (TIGR02147 family)